MVTVFDQFDHPQDKKINQIEHLIDISVALSTEKDTTKLLEQILVAAKTLTHADGGTIYSITDDQQLKFETVINDTLEMYLGGSSGKTINFSSIPLVIDQQPNLTALVAFAANTDQVINIPDAYQPFDGFDMTMAKKMDKEIGYHTQSVLTIPMKNHQGELNGVLQLINAQDKNEIIPFDAQVVSVITALASQAAVALTNRQLIDEMEALFRAFTKLLAHSIDEKSPYTGGHCRRVPEITMMLATAASDSNNTAFKDFSMSEADLYELNIAAWLHDCGKVATPEYVMDKATKLETIFDRIEYVEARFEIAKRDLELAYQQEKMSLLEQGLAEQIENLTSSFNNTLDKLAQDLAFLTKANIGGEFMTREDQDRVKQIAEQTQIVINGQQQNLLDSDLVENLSIAKGTLNEAERSIVNRHISVTIDMLEALPFPKHLRRVPEYAGGHHEKMDGTGYPNGLTREQMSIPARIMAIADIFEALTASDRPYKKSKTLSECLRILGLMKQEQHIDPDLFDLFVDNKIYLKFADEFLEDFQIDEVDVNQIPAYIPAEFRS